MYALRQVVMASFFFSFLASGSAAESKKPHRGRRLAAETLESRQMLDAAGLVPVGAQPDGALSGKIVYAHAGHGITINDAETGWGYQRPLLLDMVEDTGNQDQLTYFAQDLWEAGATVVPLRPIGNQANEAVLDNDDAGVSFSGGWSNSAGGVYFGDSGDVPFRFASTSPVETAVATYRPTLPEGGFYPVYAWSPAGTNRATDQLYRVHHTGGATEVTIDHSRVGNGLVYLGTYHFDAGTDGYVEISNRSDDAGRVVVADMIRFGNGVGDITPNNSSSVSGELRENEAGLYWVEWHVNRSQGIPTSEYRTTSQDDNATVSLAPRWAEYMNQANVGTLSDRVFVSYHSNATTGNPATATARGVIALHNTATGGATPNQFTLALNLAQEINSDVVAQNALFESGNWQSRSSLTLNASFNYGEINNSRINNEFDATIVETGFHDNTQDAAMLRDPRVRDALSRATVQGLVDYFRAIGDFSVSDVDVPGRVAELTAETGAPGEVTLSWTPSGVSGALGGSPDGYMIYASTDGLGFDGGTYVDGGATTAHTIAGLTAGETYYFRVAAVNAGGQGDFSEVAAAKPSASPEKVLIVNGFDRLSEDLVTAEQFRSTSNTNDRVRPQDANSFAYAVDVAEAIASTGATPAISTASNESVADGSVDLADYDAVFWIGGEESTFDEAFSNTEQTRVAAYLAGGGKLFVSGAEIGWDLDAQAGGAAFYNNSLRADYAADDAGTNQAAGTAGGVFEGLNLEFGGADAAYAVEFPDVLTPTGGSTAALTYVGGVGGTAAVQYENAGTGEQLVMLGFPFETIPSAAQRTEAMVRVLEYFGFDTVAPTVTSEVLDNDDGAPTYTENGFWNSRAGDDGGTYRAIFAGSPATATWTGTAPDADSFEVLIRTGSESSPATNVRYQVTSGGEVRTVFADQSTPNAWVSIGQFAGGGGTAMVQLQAQFSSGGVWVAADRVRFDTTSRATTGPGDFNGDGVVNAADYTLWRDTEATIVTPRSGADADGSGLVDAADYTAWVNTFGDTVPIPAAAASASAAAASTASAVTPDLPAGLVLGGVPTPNAPGVSLGPAVSAGAPPTEADDSAAKALLLVVGQPFDTDPDATDAAFGETEETATDVGTANESASDDAFADGLL